MVLLGSLSFRPAAAARTRLLPLAAVCTLVSLAIWRLPSCSYVHASVQLPVHTFISAGQRLLPCILKTTASEHRHFVARRCSSDPARAPSNAPLSAPTQLEEWRVLLRRGDAQAKSGALEGACDTYLDALDALYDVGQVSSPNAVRVHIRAGDMHTQLGKPKAAMQHYLKVHRMLEKQDKFETPEHAGLLAKIANARTIAGDARSALANLKQARRIMQDNDLLGTQNGARVLRSLGNAIASQKGAVEYDFEEAVRLLERARDIFRSESLLDSEQGIGLLTDLGQAQAKLKLFESAIISYTAAREVLEAQGSFQTPRGAALVVLTGDALRSRMLQDSALEAYEEAKSILRECGQLNTQEGACLLSKIGFLYMQQYDREEAVAACELAETIFAHLGNLDTPEAGELLLERGMQLAEIGDILGSVQKLWLAREAFEVNKLMVTTRGAQLLETLGDMRTKQGQFKFAWKLYRKAQNVFKKLGAQPDLFSETPEGERLSLKIRTVRESFEKVEPLEHSKRRRKDNRKNDNRKDEPEETVKKIKWWAKKKWPQSMKTVAAHEKRGTMDPDSARRSNSLLRGLPSDTGWKRPETSFKPFDILNN